MKKLKLFLHYITDNIPHLPRRVWDSLPKYGKRSVQVFLVLFMFYLTSVYRIEPNEMGISWNPITGNLTGDTVPGFYLSAPWSMESNLDLRPCRVCVTTSANSYSCKLVSFDNKHWKEFVKVQGFRYYWWSNRISFNMGYREEYRGFRDILRGYAYGNESYNFIKIEDANYSNYAN